MLLSGKTLYVDMVDIKPPGIFLILAGFQSVIGYSVFGIRLLVAIWIGLTAFMIFLTGKLLVKDDRVAIASGIIYIFFISTWSFYGLSITPEIFFNLFTISSLFVLLDMKSTGRFFWAGLIAGLGFMVKYLVLFDFAAIVLLILINEIRQEKLPVNRLMYSLLGAGIGFLLPFAGTNLWYYLNGHFDALYNVVYLAPSRYPSAFEPWKMLKFLLDFHLRFLPVFFLFYYVLFAKMPGVPHLSFTRRLVMLWSAFALVAVMLAGKTFGHYMIQLMLPVSIAAGSFFQSQYEFPLYFNRVVSGRVGIIILATLFIGISAMKLEYVFRKDVPQEIAEYLKPKLKEGDIIYTGNYHHIIYYLLRKDSPTKYVHRSLLINENHIRALDIDADKEFRHITSQNPLYIIVKDEYPSMIMNDFIKDHYQLEEEFDGEVYLFRRRD
jgi:4-amino-4-deoxy-L-arabinose transferase-like glycosyltransferase